MNRNISIIVAIGKNHEIGYDNKLLWKISDDLKRFKKLTTGNNIIMGRKTFESLPNGALKNRVNIVITRDQNKKFENCITVNNISDAIFKCDKNDIFIIGGAEIYKSMLPYCNKIFLTKVNEEFKDADTFFPEINFEDWIKINTEYTEKNNVNEYSHVYYELCKLN